MDSVVMQSLLAQTMNAQRMRCIVEHPDVIRCRFERAKAKQLYHCLVNVCQRSFVHDSECVCEFPVSRYPRSHELARLQMNSLTDIV